MTSVYCEGGRKNNQSPQEAYISHEQHNLNYSNLQHLLSRDNTCDFENFIQSETEVFQSEKCDFTTEHSLLPQLQLLYNKNLAIANRSRVSCINTNNNTITLKSGLEVTQGH